ncbi:MAG: hypothetical protein LBF59_08420, partial [Prevotellaceae bacterium]|nr:hypothetical protein [Prevotellaceae bacterium]
QHFFIEKIVPMVVDNIFSLRKSTIFSTTPSTIIAAKDKAFSFNLTAMPRQLTHNNTIIYPASWRAEFFVLLRVLCPTFRASGRTIYL